jgi:hypothetical protein
MNKENINLQEATKFEIKEPEIVGLRGKHREEAMAAYRKLLITSPDNNVYFARY